MKTAEVDQFLSKCKPDELTVIGKRCLELLEPDEAIELIVEWADVEEQTVNLVERLEEEL